MFKLKIVPTFYSEEYCNIKYTTNGVFYWKIRECKFDILNKKYYFKPISFHYSSAYSLFERFKTIDDVKKFEEKEKLKVKLNNEDIIANNKIEKERRDRVYKKYS